MSPLPREMIDRWKDRSEDAPGEGTVYWHILLGDNPHVRATVRKAHDRLSEFSGLHMTPLRWLHITVLISGAADAMGDKEMEAMLAKAESLLSDTPPMNVTLGRIIYHPEAIVLDIHPQDALAPIREAALAATRDVVSSGDVTTGATDSWIPHMTLCYGTAQQPAEPIISALGKELPSQSVNIEAVSLVIQRGPERLWDWHPVGAAQLQGAGKSALPV